VGNFADNGEDIVCVMVENYGQEPVGPYQVNFYVDGVIPRNGHIEESGVLEDIGLRERCFRTTIAAGQHQFVAVVDELHAVPEMNELNNRRGLTATIQREGATRPPMVAEPLSGGALDPGDSSPPMGISTPKLVDLIPTAILVKGKDAQNAGDCHPGRNDVTILVKNQGTLDATQFNVELLIAGEDGSEMLSVSSLSQGAGRDVTFADVKLTKGTHTLTARVDADNNLVESLEVNNKLDAAVSCQA
jgi:subtilase family serine protease